jgi:hypothetical protein
MRPETILSCALWLPALLAAACGGGDVGGQPPACMGNTIVARDASNYSFSSRLTFPPVKVKPNTELTFDWSMATADLRGHPVNPATDIDMVLAMMWNLTLPELETKLNADSAEMNDLTVLPLTFFAGGSQTSAKLFSFTLNGNPLTPADILPYFDATTYPPGEHVYTLMTATGTTLGQGVRMIQSFELDPASSNETVSVRADSTHIDYTADLHSLQAAQVSGGTATITLDWSTMTKNALDNPFILTNITRAIVGHYTQTPTELETRFLDLELIASQLYRAALPCGHRGGDGARLLEVGDR